MIASTLEREVSIYALVDPRDGLIGLAEQGSGQAILAYPFGVDQSHISNLVRRHARTNPT